MRLKELLQDVETIDYDGRSDDLEISDIKIDSRAVWQGDLFIAMRGENFDGDEFIPSALARGAKVILTEGDEKGENIIKVRSARKAYALASKNFFGRACDQLRIIAVTGTNGKTTITNVTKELLTYAGAKASAIGTLGANYQDETIDTGFTTPDPYLLHKILADRKKHGDEFVIMEASAHALALDKLEGIKFEIGVLTNITEDHLDFFHTMSNYAKAKFKLFEKGRVKMGIVCADAPYCRQLLSEAEVPIVSYGYSPDADIRVLEDKKTFRGSTFTCDCLGQDIQISTPLVGDYNIKNSLACIGICKSLGVPSQLIKLGMSCINPVEGRFNIISNGEQCVIVDFAHTPDGLENLLKSASELGKHPLVVIFGCGGDRDTLKRPIMGAIAEKYADVVILTSDNPRYEDPYSILAQIHAGMKSSEVVEIENRKKAIEFALTNYKDACIVVAGKGGEKYQEIMGKKYNYNDFDVIYHYYRTHFTRIDHDENS